MVTYDSTNNRFTRKAAKLPDDILSRLQCWQIRNVATKISSQLIFCIKTASLYKHTAGNRFIRKYDMKKHLSPRPAWNNLS
jgi:hypothetical protein